MKNDIILSGIITIAVVLLVIATVGILCVFSAKQESRVYNKLTGANTTWQDALWVELRVQAAPAKDTP